MMCTIWKGFLYVGLKGIWLIYSMIKRFELYPKQWNKTIKPFTVLIETQIIIIN